MTAVSKMNESDVLKKEIFQGEPRPTELSRNIQAMLQQFTPEKTGPQVQKVIGRIAAISDRLQSVAGKARQEIVGLYTETAIQRGLMDYESKVAILEQHQRDRVAEVLGASSEDLALAA